MAITIQTTLVFARNVKRLCKRYVSMQTDLVKFRESIMTNPYQGIDLGNGMHKVRMTISAKGKGKRGGARVITYCIEQHDNEIQVILLTIYDKSDVASITKEELNAIRRLEGI